VVGNTALRKLSMRKTGLRERGFLRHPVSRRLKYIYFWTLNMYAVTG